MKYSICQKVSIIEPLTNEVIKEVLFLHGELDTPVFSIGCTVITHQLGLKDFDVVYDKRFGEPTRYKVVDIEFSLVDHPIITRAYLAPLKLIAGQHDIGSV